MRNYAADKIEAGFLTLDLKPGFAAGSFMSIRQTRASWTQRDNGVGGTIRLFNPSQSGEVDFSITTQSAVHQKLIAFASVDRRIRVVQGPLYVRDLNSNEVFAFTNAYITTKPDEQRATAPVETTWTFAYTSQHHIPNLLDVNAVGK